jgi:hypothetical protein
MRSAGEEVEVGPAQGAGEVGGVGGVGGGARPSVSVPSDEWEWEWECV